MDNMILDKLNQLMIDIDKRKEDSFIGLGLVVYSEIDELPISPLKKNDNLIELPLEGYDKILGLLLEISVFNHPFHDGFHFLSDDFKLTHLSQYFSTPIIENSNIEFQFGSRYRTALYGSFLEKVVACSVISNNHGPVIFKQGKKINPYDSLAVRV